MITHVILELVAVALTATLPFYKGLIRKIDTSVEVEDNGGMEAIDISGED